MNNSFHSLLPAVIERSRDALLPAVIERSRDALFPIPYSLFPIPHSPFPNSVTEYTAQKILATLNN